MNTRSLLLYFAKNTSGVMRETVSLRGRALGKLRGVDSNSTLFLSYFFIPNRKVEKTMRQQRSLVQLSLKSKGFLRNNTSTILTYVGSAGVVGTAIFTAKSATKASRILEEAREEKGEELTTKEKLVIATPIYIPPLLMGAATISCIFGANILNQRTQASLASAYALLDRSYKDYKNKVDDIYGNGSDEHVREEIAKDEYDNTEIKTIDGEELFYDEYSKQYFMSTKYKVQEAEYTLNRNMVMRDYAYLNEWYDELGLELVDEGYNLGWSTGQCMDMYWQPWLDFAHSKIVMDDGTECTIIRMLEEPVIDFADYI